MKLVDFSIQSASKYGDLCVTASIPIISISSPFKSTLPDIIGLTKTQFSEILQINYLGETYLWKILSKVFEIVQKSLQLCCKFRACSFIIATPDHNADATDKLKTMKTI